MLLGIFVLLIAISTATTLFCISSKRQKEEICALRIYIYEHCQDEMRSETLKKYIRIWKNQNRK